MANLRNLQFLRNATPYQSKEQAITELRALTGLTDGSIVLGRYYENDEIKTIAGYAYSGSSSQSLSIIDVEGNIDELRTEINNKLGTGVTSANTVTTQLANLSGTTASTSAETSVEGAKKYASAYTDSKITEVINGLDVDAITAGDGAFIKSVSEVDGKISATTADMPTVAAISESGKPIIAVAENKGTISATAGTINAEYVSISDTAGTITATDVEGAIAELYSGYTAGDAAIVSSASTSADTLAKLENIINNVIADGKSYSVANATAEEVSELGSNVKEAYKLIDEDGTKSGEYIKIYKDNTLKSVELSGQNLVFTYIVDSGESVVSVDISTFLAESEFASGVTANADGVVHGVVDGTSESFLTVGASGFKLAGVQDAINGAVGTAISGLDATVSAETSNGHVEISIEEVDGKLTAVTLTEDDIASADDLAELSGNTISGITSTGGSISVVSDNAAGNKSVNIDTDASKIKMAGFSAETSGFTAITEASTVTEAVEAIEGAFIDNEEVVAAALTDLDERINSLESGTTVPLQELSAKTLTEVVSPNNSIAFTTAATSDGTVGVSAVTDASKISGLTPVSSVTGEISGVSASDSVQTGIKNLYDSLAAEIAARKAAISAATVSSANNGIAVASGATGTTLTLTLDGVTTNDFTKTGADNALQITNNGLYLSTNWDCGTFGS